MKIVKYYNSDVVYESEKTTIKKSQIEQFHIALGIVVED